MTEVPDEFVPHDVHDFKTNAYADLGPFIRANVADLRVGPNYRVPLSNGENITTSLLMLGDATKHNILALGSDEYIEESALLAFDSSGAFVGFRHMHIDYGFRNTHIDPIGNKIIAWGTIRVAERGNGIATALELANLDYLQRVANNTQINLIQNVVNSNEEDLTELEDIFISTRDTAMLPALHEKRAEQTRWQALYGPRGKLGFSRYGKKHYKAEPTHAIPIEAIEEVTLARTRTLDATSRELIRPSVVDVIPVTNPTAVRTRRLATFRQRVVLPLAS